MKSKMSQIQVNEETTKYLTKLVDSGEYTDIDSAAEAIIKAEEYRKADEKLLKVLEEADASGIAEGFSIDKFLKEKAKVI
jgi:Arc/MetJ-type ribon-helix-helix transcriptional regulator